MFSVISIIIILISAVLITAILLQPGKGDLSATFGGLSGQFGSMFGMQRTVDFMVKLTRWLAVAILLLCIVSTKFFTDGKVEQIKPVTEGAKPPINTMQPPPVGVPK